MNKIFLFFLILIFFNNCSLNSKSKFWTKEKKVKQEIKISDKRELFVSESALQKELNPELKIELGNIKLSPDRINENNNSINKYTGNLEKISKFKFSKIKHFNQYEPEAIFEKENIIFFDNKGAIVKFDQNSKLIWKKNHYSKQEKKINPFLSFARNKNILVVVDTISKYYALNLESGNILWSFYNDAPFISDVKIKKGKIFAVDSNNVLKCYSLKDGSLIWEYKSDSSIIKSSKKTSIAITENKVLFNNSIGDVSAIDINNGNLIWLTPTANKQNLIQPYLFKTSALVIKDNAVLFSNNNNEFFSIDVDTGFINWKQKINSYVRPAAFNDLIFTISLEGYFVVIDNPSGNIIRVTDVFDQFKIKKRKKIKPIGFSIGEKDIFLSTNQGKLLIIDILTGKTKSTLKIDNEKISRPFFSNKNLYLIKEDSIIKLN